MMAWTRVKLKKLEKVLDLGCFEGAQTNFLICWTYERKGNVKDDPKVDFLLSFDFDLVTGGEGRVAIN